ncbi:MAG: LytTR family transcriptional regulator DNA-binding domain-containing protein [Lachnospiraceae bacterium]|nr:LytTR family transcriptional regulator DNA-binding domain-containing protein [Lachnospiraceae bacterium]
MLRIAICNKSKKEQAVLLDYVAKDVDIDDDYTTECFDDVESIKQRIEFGDFQFDLLFLEIDFGGNFGLELAEYLRERKIDIDVIFIAENADYITEAFRLRAFNYIVKPVDFDKFRYEMKQYLNEKKHYQKEYLAVFIQGREQMLTLNTILYFNSNARKIGAFFSNGMEEVWFYGKLDELEQNLEKYNYLRCHQSYLVSGNKIENIDTEFVYAGGEAFPISRKYADNVRKKWEQIKKERFEKIDVMPFGPKDDDESTFGGNSTVIETKTYAVGATKYGLIVGIRGPRQNASFRLYHDEEALLGRDSKQCQIVINDGAISRKHCAIKFDAEKQVYYVCDYSKNGTFVTGLGRIQPNVWVEVPKDTLVQLVNEKSAFILV